jgi:hypothetical protein
VPDGSTGMDTEATYDLGIEFQDLSKVLDRVAEVASVDGPDRWTPEHFGGLQSAKDAASTLMEVLTSLGTSVGYVAAMADGIAGALTGVATSTADVDQTNAQTMNSADGQG